MTTPRVYTINEIGTAWKTGNDIGVPEQFVSLSDHNKEVGSLKDDVRYHANQVLLAQAKILGNVILLSDHKEVVGRLELHRDTALAAEKRMDEIVLKLDESYRALQYKLAASEALVKRQAIAIAKLKDALEVCKNQRDSYALMVTPPTERNELWQNLNAALAAILQEAK